MAKIEPVAGVCCRLGDDTGIRPGSMVDAGTVADLAITFRRTNCFP